MCGDVPHRIWDLPLTLSVAWLAARRSLSANESGGIDCFDCLVTRSTVVGSSGIGISGSGTGVGDNVLSSSGGTTISGPLEISQNVCGTNLNCP